MFLTGTRAMSLLKDLRPVLPILIGAAVMLSISSGIRQSLGLFVPDLTVGVGISVSEVTFALAIQNLVWGLLQPLAGAWVVRIGFRPMIMTGSLLYVAGMIMLTFSQGLFSVMMGAGVLIGIALTCNGSAMSMAVAARPVPAAARSLVLGIVSAAGSLGATMAAPIGQSLLTTFDWRVGLAGFTLLALLMIPAAWFAGRVDGLPLPKNDAGAKQSAREALRVAGRNPLFVVMAIAYFVCGLQLVFLTVHLPSYLALCGMNPMLGAQALGLIGFFNMLGSLFFGWAGGHGNKLIMLGTIYIVRSAMVVWYFITPPTPESTLIFASVMGFLWLGVVPLVTGWIADTFGLRWQAMLAGVAFVGHQVGSFFGAWGGGLIFDVFGTYDNAWRAGAALGLTAGIIQVAVAWWGRNPPRTPPQPISVSA